MTQRNLNKYQNRILNMKINELSDLVQNSLEDMKAVDIVKLDVVGKSSMTDMLYIATGNSTRHVKNQ